MSHWVVCDEPSCNERYPIKHEARDEPRFTEGRWPGWVYLDINRPDLADRPLRLCSTWCLRAYLDRYDNRATGPHHSDTLGMTRLAAR